MSPSETVRQKGVVLGVRSGLPSATPPSSQGDPRSSSTSGGSESREPEKDWVRMVRVITSETRRGSTFVSQTTKVFILIYEYLLPVYYKYRITSNSLGYKKTLMVEIE